MKTGIYLLSGIIMCCILLCNSCTKVGGVRSDTNGTEIKSIKITGAKTVYYPGDTISLSTNLMPDGFYNWHRDSPAISISKLPTAQVLRCTKYDEGWYYVTVSDPLSTSHTDSVFIRVTNKPAAAPCSTSNNTVTFSAIPDIQFKTASWSKSPALNCMNLKGYRAINYPDINIYFHPYWNMHDPEDGAYQCSDTLGFASDDVYSVYIQSAYSGVYFEAGAGKVYVSHNDGKLQVSFCNLPMTGKFDGAFYTMTATGKLTAP